MDFVVDALLRTLPFADLAKLRFIDRTAHAVGLSKGLREKDARVAVNANVGPQDAAKIVAIGVDVDQAARLRLRIEARRNFAEFDSDRKDNVDLIEGVLRGARSLRAVAPADRERVRLANNSLAAHARGHRSLQNFGETSELLRKIHAAHAGVDADALPAIREQGHRLAE